MSYASLAAVLVEALPKGTFDAVVTGDMVRNGKPDPEAYLMAAELLGVDIKECVAFEDSISGVASAENSGARTVAIPHLIDLPEKPGRNRIGSLEEVDLEFFARILSGEVIDSLKQ